MVDRSHGLRAGGRLEVDQQWAARGGLCLDEEHSPDLRRSEIFRDHKAHEDQKFTSYEELFAHSAHTLSLIGK